MRRDRREAVGFVEGLRDAGALAEAWAETARSVADQNRRRASADVRDAFLAQIRELDPNLLQAYVTERVAAGVLGLATALQARAAEEASDAMLSTMGEVPVEEATMPGVPDPATSLVMDLDE